MGSLRCFFMRFPLNVILGAALGLGIGYGARQLLHDKPEPLVADAQPGQKADTVEKEEPQAKPLAAFGLQPVVADDEPETEDDGLPDQKSDRYDRTKPKTIWVRGYVVRNGKINVFLSDGRTFTERDPELGPVERNSATIAGVKYFMASPEPRKARESAKSEGTGEPRLVHVDVTTGPEIDPNLPRSSGIPDSQLYGFGQTLLHTEQSLRDDAEEMLKDRMHHE
jgi:hypothetical protein